MAAGAAAVPRAAVIAACVAWLVWPGVARSSGGVILEVRGTAVVVAMAASAAAIAFFYWYVRSRLTEHTSAVPPDLAAIVQELAAREDGGVLCLPTMYADFVCYQSGKSILWGGHSGDLTKFEALFPVVRERLERLIGQYGVRYVLLDEAYVRAADLELEPMLRMVARRGQFVLYET